MRAAAGSNKFLVQLWKDFNNVLFGKVRLKYIFFYFENTSKKKTFYKKISKILIILPLPPQMAESMRKRMLCDLVRSEKRLKTKVASPGYVKSVIVNASLVVVERKKPVICLNRPLFVACTILDVAKVIICIFLVFFFADCSLRNFWMYPKLFI